MNETALDQANEEVLAYDVSDDALEAAAGSSQMPGRTFYGCPPPMPLSVSYHCQLTVGQEIAQS